MSLLKGKQIPIGITLVVGLMMIVNYYFGATLPAVKSTTTLVQNWTVIVAAFALIIGLINISRIHINHLLKRSKGQWFFSLWCLAIMYIMIALGLFGTTKNPGYQWLYNYVFLPVDATMYSSLAFFISSAAYRAFRARNVESILLLSSGVVIMLMNAPIGEIIWTGFPVIGDWIMSVPNVAAQRAIMICVVMGSVSLGLRTLLGMERGYLGREE